MALQWRALCCHSCFPHPWKQHHSCALRHFFSSKCFYVLFLHLPLGKVIPPHAHLASPSFSTAAKKMPLRGWDSSRCSFSSICCRCREAVCSDDSQESQPSPGQLSWKPLVPAASPVAAANRGKAMGRGSIPGESAIACVWKNWELSSPAKMDGLYPQFPSFPLSWWQMIVSEEITAGCVAQHDSGLRWHELLVSICEAFGFACTMSLLAGEQTFTDETSSCERHSRNDKKWACEARKSTLRRRCTISKPLSFPCSSENGFFIFFFLFLSVFMSYNFS